MPMTTQPIEMKVLMNHIYEYQKGVRQMVLYTLNRRYLEYAEQRLQHLQISYVVQPAGRKRSTSSLGAGSVWMPFALWLPARSMSCRPRRTLCWVPFWATTFAVSANAIANASSAEGVAWDVRFGHLRFYA